MVFAWCLRGVCVMFAWCLPGVCVTFPWCLCGVCVVSVWNIKTYLESVEHHRKEV